MATASSRAIWYAATKKSSPRGGMLYIRCNVKPGASKAREGVLSVDDEAIEVCVSAQAREGEANKAVVKVLSEILNVPKSDLQITQGLKSRSKTIALLAKSWAGGGANVNEEDYVDQVKACLEKATCDS
ncbi:hypothetical protein B0H66DRAFT_531029 [Apodospora peruviana]|uniref:Uncharacterized protein n=1 Tax=Apodospora peruviana TaxID=516989 RepID=A0AAE0M705_9PEZI|nr:hypothetical protein B0H66DRAFT_531029 [Apodospora peruviana]